MTVPFVVSGTAVHVPISVRPVLVLALQLPDRSLFALLAVSWRTAACPLDNSAVATSKHRTRPGFRSTVTSSQEINGRQTSLALDEQLDMLLRGPALEPRILRPVGTCENTCPGTRAA